MNKVEDTKFSSMDHGILEPINAKKCEFILFENDSMFIKTMIHDRESQAISKEVDSHQYFYEMHIAQYCSFFDSNGHE